MALHGNIVGDDNTATGSRALSNKHRQQQHGHRCGALQSNAASANTAHGAFALSSNTIGNQNTATGFNALGSNTTGSNNTATGFGALQNNKADANTAHGANALFSNTGGIQNTATGFNALLSNTAGNHNTANGFNALQSNTTGNNNTAMRSGALNHSQPAAATRLRVKVRSNDHNRQQQHRVGLQAGANLTTGSNNIEIGNVGVAGDANMIRIGKQGTQTGTFVAGIFGSTVASGVGVIVNSSGQLGTVLSSERFKEAIKPMDKVSEAILSLQPVTFRYKQELDPNGIPQFGLIAEQVEKVNPDLVVRGEDGKVTTVRYEAVNAMLLNEFLKEHRKVEEQEATIAEMKSAIAKQQATNSQQQKEIKALFAGLHKVAAQLESGKPALRIVNQ